MKNNRPLLISLIIIVALFIGAIVFVPQLTKQTDDPATELDLSKYDTSKFIGENDDNGQIADHVKGASLDKAKVIIYEYADYQCSGCAIMNPWMKEIIEEYKDEVAVIFRAFPLTSIHPYGIAAASAVEAAGLQGYWEEYGDLLFANQAEWSAVAAKKRNEYFAEYFTVVSKGNGDVDKFNEDYASDRVKAKVNFDKAISESYNLSATPSFVDENGEEIDWTSNVEQTKTGIQAFFRNYINKKLGK